jgi:predicted exporter
LSRWGVAAACFALAVLLAAALLVRALLAGLPVETDLLALLPTDARQPRVEEAIRRMADAGSREVVLLVGADDGERAVRAADAAAAKLSSAPGMGRVVSRIEGDLLSEAQATYLPHRYALLTSDQREALEHQSDAALVAQAARALYAPVGPPRLAPLAADPLGLFSGFLLDRAAASALRPERNHLVVHEGQRTFVAVLAQLDRGGMSMGDQQAQVRAVDAATQAAREAGAQEVLRAGYVFHAAAAAAQAEHEMSTIGFGSAAGILVLILLAFRSPRSLALVALPVVVGIVCALGYSLLLMPKLHLLTLVFGTSIIGVAVDYPILFLSGRLAEGEWSFAARRTAVLPPLATAVATSLLAYAALAALPFPILRQMGCFALIGLASAWLTALLWVPPLSRRLPPLSDGRLPALLLGAQRRWPRVGRNVLGATLVLLSLAAVAGLLRLRVDDDVHGLYAKDATLVAQQERVERLLRLPSAGQFFLLSAPDAEHLLQTDEALSAALEPLLTDGTLSGFQAISRFVPSARRQREDAALERRRLYAPGAVVDQLFATLGDPALAQEARAQMERAASPLTLSSWLASPLSTPFRALWLGEEGSGVGAVVTVSGVAGASALARLSTVAKGLPGVRFVDHPKAVSTTLGTFRVRLTWMMAVGYALIAFGLWLRYRKDAWRVLLPTLLACLFTFGAFGWFHVPLNLFCIFGLLLSLDMGVDYGVYMQERGAGDFRISVLSASLAALSTLLAFGLLALSHTPAMRGFGLTVLLAIGGAWLLAPCFQRRTSAS